MKFSRVLRTVFLVAAATLPAMTTAYQVQPMVAELTTAGNKSSITYRVINPSDIPVPIEVEVYKRSFDENQQEILTEAEDDFIVLPPQIDVPANGYQVFRAQYIGESEFEKSQSYRIIFKQLPLENDGQESQVNMIFNFATLVFISQPDASGTLTQKIICDDAGSCTLNIVNTGDAVVNMVQSSIHFDGEMKADWQWLQNNMPVTFLLPEHVLNINIDELIAEGKPPTLAELVPANNAN